MLEIISLFIFFNVMIFSLAIIYAYDKVKKNYG